VFGAGITVWFCYLYYSNLFASDNRKLRIGNQYLGIGIWGWGMGNWALGIGGSTSDLNMYSQAQPGNNKK
jgi:hypothetical protein